MLEAALSMRKLLGKIEITIPTLYPGHCALLVSVYGLILAFFYLWRLPSVTERYKRFQEKVLSGVRNCSE